MLKNSDPVQKLQSEFLSLSDEEKKRFKQFLENHEVRATPASLLSEEEHCFLRKLYACSITQ